MGSEEETMTRMTPEQRRAMRREQIERCLATTMTIKDWCALNGVPESTMYTWMARFRKEEPELFETPNASQWIELSRESIAAQTALATKAGAGGAATAATIAPPEAGCPPSGAPVIVRLNGAEVVVPQGAADAFLSSVLKAVASL